MTITAIFVLERETKGALLYREIDPTTSRPLDWRDDMKIGTLYLRKAGIEGKPKSIKVEITILAPQGLDSL